MADSKIVPREPTAEMIDAGPDDLTSDEKRRAWQAMYDAAPAQAAEPREAVQFAAERDAERKRGDVLWQECENLRLRLADTDAAAALRRAEALREALTALVTCDERDHANPAAYYVAMRKSMQKARAALAAPLSKEGT